MRVENFPSFFNINVCTAQQASPVEQLASMLNEKAEDRSPLEAARQALLDAKSRLDQQRDEHIEAALSGYKALRSRQTSYENALSEQQAQLEEFQSLNSRRDAISEELSAARADLAAYAADGTTQDSAPCELSLRTGSLEQELAGIDQDIAALVERANLRANGQRQYANYLEETNQGGYAAFQYREQGEYTRENFAAEASGMIGRLKTGAEQWRERVSAYCGQYGLTASDFESYMRERSRLGSVYFAARQRAAELLHAAEYAAPAQRAAQTAPTENRAEPVNNFDTVELSGSALRHVQRSVLIAASGSAEAELAGKADDIGK